MVAFVTAFVPVASARDRDPAARGVGTVEILSSWAGVQALLAHRVAHALDESDVPLAPMAISYVTRAVTGIEARRTPADPRRAGSSGRPAR